MCLVILISKFKFTVKFLKFFCFLIKFRLFLPLGRRPVLKSPGCPTGLAIGCKLSAPKSSTAMSACRPCKIDSSFMNALAFLVPTYLDDFFANFLQMFGRGIHFTSYRFGSVVNMVVYPYKPTQISDLFNENCVSIIIFACLRRFI